MPHRSTVTTVLVATVVAAAPGGVCGQSASALSDTTSAADTLAPDTAVAPTQGGLPVFLTVGLAYGRRGDRCATCTSRENKNSFSGHVSLGKQLGHGLGVGLHASVWRHGAPGPEGPADSTGTATPTTLTNTLGNGSVVFSWQVWHIWVQAGGGVAWAGQDLADGGYDTLVHASGMGIGYTAGGGFALPVASLVSLAFFGNVNAGSYDLTSPVAVVKRGVKHRYVEIGVGLTLR